MQPALAPGLGKAHRSIPAPHQQLPRGGSRVGSYGVRMLGCGGSFATGWAGAVTAPTLS